MLFPQTPPQTQTQADALSHSQQQQPPPQPQQQQQVVANLRAVPLFLISITVLTLPPPHTQQQLQQLQQQQQQPQQQQQQLTQAHVQLHTQHYALSQQQAAAHQQLGFVPRPPGGAHGAGGGAMLSALSQGMLAAGLYTCAEPQGPGGSTRAPICPLVIGAGASPPAWSARDACGSFSGQLGASSTPVAIPVLRPSSYPSGGSSQDSPCVSSYERLSGERAGIAPPALGRSPLDGAMRIVQAERAATSPYIAAQSAGSPFVSAHHSSAHANQRHALSLARTPPLGVPVQLVGSGHAGSGNFALFRPVSLASSPPLFGTSPPVMAVGGSPFLLPHTHSAYSPQSSSPHGSVSSKASSRRGSPFAADSPGRGALGGILSSATYGTLRPVARMSVQHMFPSSAPTGGMRSMPGSQHGLPNASELDSHSHLVEGAEGASPLAGTMRGVESSSLSRSVVSLSRDLDALRMSLNLGPAGSSVEHPSVRCDGAAERRSQEVSGRPRSRSRTSGTGRGEGPLPQPHHSARRVSYSPSRRCAATISTSDAARPSLSPPPRHRSVSLFAPLIRALHIIRDSIMVRSSAIEGVHSHTGM
ncbi:hypothetical protein T492DRAFT_515839 [Pavlovales sp. CCMP2436]|nr:hypothetical protein T492DRAFT_515839 [Pavlovales sp. CCMP2436]